MAGRRDEEGGPTKMAPGRGERKGEFEREGASGYDCGCGS